MIRPLVLWILVPLSFTWACTSDDDCGELECEDGECINPFYRTGCLAKYTDWKRVRICSSMDPPEAFREGYCQSPSLDYMETRLLAQNWDSSFFSTWIFQIILSEMLGVPASVETGHFGLHNDFYHRESSLDYGTSDPLFSELDTASRVGDCRDVGRNADKYTPCAHMVLEAWPATGVDFSSKERPRSLGALGKNNFFIPRFLAEQDMTMVYYSGLAGEANRHKLAQTFRRPTTWRHYCEQVSNHSCQVDDGIARRPPETSSEEESYFLDGWYTGHFRMTDENDCELYPNDCTGHIADYPCTWTTYTTQQLHHLDIALKSNGPSGNGGYGSAAQFGQIWRAANATKSPVIMLYWEPSALYQDFIGTDAQFTKIGFPPPTQKCIDARANLTAGCPSTWEMLIGDPEGSCGWPSEPLNKLISNSFRELTTGRGLPPALTSPAYEAYLSFHISDLEYGQIFQARKDGGISSREAVCRWVVEHLDEIQSFIPPSYPRTSSEKDISGADYAAIALAFSVTTAILVSSVIIHQKDKRETLRHIQAHFLYFILLGSFLVGVATLLLSFPPTNVSCTLVVWLTDIGYLLQFLPIVFRLGAINRLIREGKQMQRVQLKMHKVNRAVEVSLCILCVFLITWTAADTPQKQIEYELTGYHDSNDERVVLSSEYCGSDSDVWMLVSFSWQSAILLPATIVAFVASQIQDDINDTSTLAVVLCSRSLFLLLRTSVFFQGEENRSDTMVYISMMLSGDTLVTLCLYLLPKMLSSATTTESNTQAELFLNTTILSADISGFTAWSSVREPIQVFKFLESLYDSFELIAIRHKIFKVETTGDRFVAASGLPESRSDHALAMARFASEILKRMEAICKKLEMQFGPDTSDLRLRIGLHSGPVMGGFRRGKASRFQLFGDTMTTASLIHDTGESNRIHMSQTTADLLLKAGRTKWVDPRTTKIRTLEKGEIQTYWMNRARPTVAASEQGETPSIGQSQPSDLPDEFDDAAQMESVERWVHWNVDSLRPLLERIVARREGQSVFTAAKTTRLDVAIDKIPLLEVKEVIELPEFDKDAAKREQVFIDETSLSKTVLRQLRDYISTIASMHPNHPYHNFAHASYVVMAVMKYLNRIMGASEMEVFDDHRHSTTALAAIHDHTYGIASDPLTQFACVFSALIQDTDHPGVSNAQLAKENTRIALVYQRRSIAEQKSFDIAWDLFMGRDYDAVRSTICSTDAELVRFRSMVINCVMATDVDDAELKSLRNNRWAKAFDDNAVQKAGSRLAVNRKATIVIEHLIQAADIAHTCQHWSIYRKWNERMFEECYLAYQQGRAERNPAEYWYDGEIAFFDYYVIPLSQKLRDCGVFGPTSDENLNYAQNNRKTWVTEGKQIVADMLLLHTEPT